MAVGLVLALLPVVARRPDRFSETCQVSKDVPIVAHDPPSTLLPPHTTQITLSVQSAQATTCAYALEHALPYDQMTPFDQGAGTLRSAQGRLLAHQTAIAGLDPDPNTVNHVYVRCASQPDFVLALQYRALSDANPPFPRTGNLWGWWEFVEHGLPSDALCPHAARIDLWLGAGFSGSQIAELRRLNPHIRVLTSINAVENDGLPDDHYLKDVNGNRIEVWPGSYRLNLTRLDVAEHQARYAYQTVLDSGLMADGVFFDNVFTAQSWLTQDIYGNPVQIDADEDGLPDDPAVLDAAWRAGVLHELRTFRQWMPHAIVSGHAMDIADPEIAALFNGISVGFWTADVLEGEMAFADLWDAYHAWLTEAQQPPVTMFESSPLDEIAYGYDYAPWDGKVPPATLAFARTCFPWMRFGLALTLMGDGYFAHEFGDTWHGNDWWYDELDVYLGHPLGPAEQVDLGGPPPVNLVENGDFEAPIEPPWGFWANAGAGCTASVQRDTADAVSGTASARIEIAATSGTDWHIEFAQHQRSLQQGVTYQVTFWAKADADKLTERPGDAPRSITLSAQKDSPDWDNYGLWRRVAIGTAWQLYAVSFEANATVDDARLQFMVGETAGTVWLDDVCLAVRPPNVFRRAFTQGLVLLNATPAAQAIDVGPGYRRLVGDQAPFFETILDDGDAAFSATGTWLEAAYDSGEWQASGPFYHDWGSGCHERSGADGEARWDLPIAASDTYTITAWWPAAPAGANWNASVTYQVVAAGQAVAEATFDQRTGGDEWHLVAAVPLSPADAPYVRMTCQGPAPCIADALHVRSQARYNDGSPAGQVTLQPMDGIVLLRVWPYQVFLPLVARAHL